jgi:hypothetical protein
MGVDDGLGTVAEAQLAVDVCHTIWAGVGARDARR